MTYRILVVDDHEVVRLGLRTLLSNQPDFVVVDEAGSAEEALDKAGVTVNKNAIPFDKRPPAVASGDRSGCCKRPTNCCSFNSGR